MKLLFVPAFQTLCNHLPIAAKVIKLADLFLNAASTTHLARHRSYTVVHDNSQIRP
jgi:hypothetical protein